MNKRAYEMSVLCVLTLIAGCSTGGDASHSSVDDKEASFAEPVYSVSKYEADRDPQKDLAATIRQASRDGKRILLEVGGNW